MGDAKETAGEAPAAWTEAAWTAFEAATRRRALAAGEARAWPIVARAARRVMRAYTTGFFLASRFLPRQKRDRVEIIYATVRYPDEVADTFPLSADERGARLEAWAAAYETALACGGLRESLEAGVPCFLAAFREIVRRHGIPPEHYRAFLDAMRRDIRPRPFATLDDLVENYVYGSAVVVGYFLAHMYGAAAPERLSDALAAARELGIGLQLTNFVRDVAEDRRRGRLYLPLDLLRAEGLGPDADPRDPTARAGFERAIRRMAGIAEEYYARAARGLDAFAPDSRAAIRACIEVYGALNRRIRADGTIGRRESVPLREKWRCLPPSKYWRIPLAYLAP